MRKAQVAAGDVHVGGRGHVLGSPCSLLSYGWEEPDCESTFPWSFFSKDINSVLHHNGDLPIHDPVWLLSSSLSLMKLGSRCSKACFPELETTLTLLMKSCKEKFHFNELHVVKIQIRKWCYKVATVDWHFLVSLYCAAFCGFVNSKQIFGLLINLLHINVTSASGRSTFVNLS